MNRPTKPQNQERTDNKPKPADSKPQFSDARPLTQREKFIQAAHGLESVFGKGCAF